MKLRDKNEETTKEDDDEVEEIIINEEKSYKVIEELRSIRKVCVFIFIN